LPHFDRVGELVKIEQHEHALEERAARPRLEPVGKLELVRHRVIRVYSRQRPQQRDRIPVTAALYLNLLHEFSFESRGLLTAVSDMLSARSRSRAVI
jgi:hypothetical protein